MTNTAVSLCKMLSFKGGLVVWTKLFNLFITDVGVSTTEEFAWVYKTKFLGS